MDSIARLHRAIELLESNIEEGNSVRQIRIFLAVAEHEGISMPDLAALLDLPQPTLSRNIKLLSRYTEVGPNGERQVKGVDLLTTGPDIDYRRRFAVYLTQKGRELTQKLQEIIGEGKVRRSS